MKREPDFVEKPDPIIPDVDVTVEEASKWLGTQKNGRPPRAIAAKVVAINKEIKRPKTIIKTAKGIKQVSKTDLFLEEFLKNGGNATQAALKVFNCSTVAIAASTGSIYLKKAREMGRVYMEQKGYGYGKMLQVATKKMEESKDPEWWDRLMKIADYEDFITKKTAAPVSVNVFQAHKNFTSEYIDGEVEGELEEFGEGEEAEE